VEPVTDTPSPDSGRVVTALAALPSALEENLLVSAAEVLELHASKMVLVLLYFVKEAALFGGKSRKQGALPLCRTAMQHV
jgi:hypothetical protein